MSVLRLSGIALLVAVAAFSGAGALHVPAGVGGPILTRVFGLAEDEKVYAYSRISPSGRYLVYAAERGSVGRTVVPTRTVTVVDLKTRQKAFSEAGIDGYWSPDGDRLIFLSSLKGQNVSIWRRATGDTIRDVAPPQLGDYFSWGVRDGRDLIVTIKSNFYFLTGNRAVLPHAEVPACGVIGRGTRPLVSKDGYRISTFVSGTIVVRGLSDCDGVFDTGIQGGKADFSYDGRYIAFHAPKMDLTGYEIDVVDLEKRTVRRVTNLAGSSFFPSWTRDGRLCFRYDAPDYSGFIMASDVFAAPERPLAAVVTRVSGELQWSQLFPETPAPSHRMNVVVIWAPWSAHSPDALSDLQRAASEWRARGIDVGVFAAREAAGGKRGADQLRRLYGISVPEIPFAAERLPLTEAVNQIPTTLLFRGRQLVDRRLGAQSVDELLGWVAQSLKAH